MNSERKKFRIEEIGDVKSGKRLPLGDSLIDEPTPFPYIRLVDIADGKVQRERLRFLSPETRATIKRYVVNSDDVCLAIVGNTIGVVFYIDKKFDDVNLTENAARITNLCNLISSRYLYYYLTSPIGQTEILARKVGSAQGKLPLYNIKSLEIEVPSRKEQDKIVEILDAVSSKIDLLRETNATLEAIAQALFKSWFVDFDPVHAKQEGRAPEGMDEATAALFPDGFEESVLGLVPRGWMCSKLADTCTYLSRGLSPKYVEQGGVLVLNQKCIRDFSVDYSKGRRHDPIQRKTEGRNLAIGDVLVNSTGIGTLGRVAQILELPEPAITDSHVTVVRAGSTLTWSYLGQWMRRKQPEIEAMGEGSTGQTELSKAKLGDLRILVPSSKVLESFDTVVVQLKQQVALNERKASTLSTLRDTLLPRLISGQLRLADVEELHA